MNDKAMEAARDEQGYFDATDTYAEYVGLKNAFEAGWNARQPKPCVWTLRDHKQVNCYQPECQNQDMWCVRLHEADFCPYCGGKIENKPADSGDDIFISPIRNAIPVTVRAALQKKGR